VRHNSSNVLVLKRGNPLPAKGSVENKAPIQNTRQQDKKRRGKELSQKKKTSIRKIGAIGSRRKGGKRLTVI